MRSCLKKRACLQQVVVATVAIIKPQTQWQDRKLREKLSKVACPYSGETCGSVECILEDVIDAALELTRLMALDYYEQDAGAA